MEDPNLQFAKLEISGKKKWLWPVLILVAIVIAIVIYIIHVQSRTTSVPINSSQATNDCGNGICEKIENVKESCPQDCGQTDSSKQEFVAPASTDNTSTASTSEGGNVLYLGFMVHLEGWNDDQIQARYQAHVEAVKRYAYLFETYGGKLTLESKEFTDGEIKWGGTVLKDLQARGHDIGVHADVGGSPQKISTADFASQIKAPKDKLAQLGITARHVSGICSTNDFVAASIQAGYKFMTGGVAYCTQAMPMKERPEKYKNCKNAGSCHQVYPEELKDRISPWRMLSSATWTTNNPSGALGIIPSAGSLQCMADYKTSDASMVECEFKEDDIDAAIEELEAAIKLTNKDKINTYYFANSLGSELDNALLEKWLSRVKNLVDQGKIQWKTMPEMYDEYVALEKE